MDITQIIMIVVVGLILLLCIACSVNIFLLKRRRKRSLKLQECGQKYKQKIYAYKKVEIKNKTIPTSSYISRILMKRTKIDRDTDRIYNSINQVNHGK